MVYTHLLVGLYVAYIKTFAQLLFPFFAFLQNIQTQETTKNFEEEKGNKGK